MNSQRIAAGARQSGRWSSNVKSRILASSILAAAATLLGSQAGAQSLDYAGLEALFGEPVTASVTGSPQRASDVPASMIIITAEDIRRSGARDIPGILSHVSGIEVDRTSSEHADVAVRGYNQAFNPRLLVLVDGRQVYADYYGFTPWSTIPVELDAIRQIEVVKGPSGALFGFNAAGGVVNIVTRNPLSDPIEPTVSLSAGTRDFVQAAGVSSFRFSDNIALAVSAGSRESSDYSSPRQPADIGVAGANRRDATSADLHVALSPNVDFGVELTYSAAEQTEMAPTYTLSRGEYETASIRTHWQADTGLGLVQANLYRNEIETSAFLAGSAEPVRRFDNHVLVAQLEDVFTVGTRHVVRIAGEYRNNSMATTPIGGAEVSYDVLALTSMWNFSLSPRLSLSNAVRVDRWELGRTGFLPPEYVADFGLSNALWDIDRDESSFNSGLTWKMTSDATLRFSAGRARQLPNLLGLGGDFSSFFGFYFLGIPWLEPTDVSNVELHWERRLPAAGMNLGLGIFDGETENIQSVLFGNQGNSDTRGLEATIDADVGEHWNWDIGLLVQQVRDDLDPLFPPTLTYVDYEASTPERSLKGHFAWTKGRWEIDGYVRYQSRTRGLRGPNPGEMTGRFVDIPSHTAADISVGYAVGEQMRVSVSGRNLTNSSQRQTSAPEVEREVFATIGYRF